MGMIGGRWTLCSELGVRDDKARYINRHLLVSLGGNFDDLDQNWYSARNNFCINLV